MQKLNILFNSEASYLGTGYGVYYNNIIKYLWETGKYNIVELASFADPDDPRNQTIPWTFIPVRPNRRNPAEIEEFNRNEFQNTYGKWKFEPTLVRHKPDVVISVRDPWMSRYEVLSPLRKYYKLYTMPTVDAEPLQEEWVAIYADTDKVFTYTDFGFNQLLKQSNGSVNLIDSAPPAADYDVYLPLRLNREAFGIPNDSFVVGMIAKNQRRKLFPNLIEDFKVFLQSIPTEKQQKCFLYLHTCWPDIGWNIPRLIQDSGIGDRILVTYTCKACNKWFPSVFHYSNRHCVHCGNISARMPETHDSLNRQDLAVVFNLFDVYVQYASCEGFGMPQVEAAACGLPVMSVDYSAMEDVVRKLGGFPIKLAKKVRELETHRMTAIPDTDSFVKILKHLFYMSREARASLGFQCRQNAMKHYQWSDTCKKWENAIDNESYLPHHMTWDSPPKLHTPNLNVPTNLSQYDLVKWCLMHVANRPELVDTYWHASICRDLLWNTRIASVSGFHFSEMSIGSIPHGSKYGLDEFVTEMKNLCYEKNYWEQQKRG